MLAAGGGAASAAFDGRCGRAAAAAWRRLTPGLTMITRPPGARLNRAVAVRPRLRRGSGSAAAAALLATAACGSPHRLAMRRRRSACDAATLGRCRCAVSVADKLGGEKSSSSPRAAVRPRAAAATGRVGAAAGGDASAAAISHAAAGPRTRRSATATAA